MIFLLFNMNLGHASVIENVEVYFIEEKKNNSLEKSLRSVPLFGSIVKENSVVGKTVIVKKKGGRTEILFAGKNFQLNQGDDLSFEWSGNDIAINLRAKTVKSINKANNGKTEFQLRKVYDTKNLEAEIESVLVNLKAEQNKNNELSKELENKANQLDMNSDKLNIALQSLTEREIEVKKEKEKSSVLSSEVLSNQSEIVTLKNMILELEEKASSEKKNLSDRSQEIKNLKSQLSILNLKTEDQEGLIEQYKGKLEDAETALNEIQEKNLSAKLELANQEINFLKEKLKDQKKSLKSLEVLQENNRTIELTEKLSGLQLELQKYKSLAEISDLSENDKIQILRKKIEVLETANIDLNNKIETFEKQEVIANEEIKRELEDYKNNNKTLTKKINTCETNQEMNLTKLEDLKKEFQATTEELELLRETHADLKSKMPKSKGGTALCLEW